MLRDESRQAAEDRDLAVAAHEKYAKETKEVEAELREVSRVGHPTWDTARITGGYPQRYVTSYLKARLVEVLADRRARTKEYEDLARERTISARDKERLIREVRRELAPLADGLADRTRRERVARLRTKVRLNRKSATRIQALARGGIYREAVARLLRHGTDQWEVHACDLSGEDYYFNTISQTSRWTKPCELDMAIVPENRNALSRGKLGDIVKDATTADFGMGGAITDDIETVETSQEPYDARRPPPGKWITQ